MATLCVTGSRQVGSDITTDRLWVWSNGLEDCGAGCVTRITSEGGVLLCLMLQGFTWKLEENKTVVCEFGMRGGGVRPCFVCSSITAYMQVRGPLFSERPGPSTGVVVGLLTCWPKQSLWGGF